MLPIVSIVLALPQGPLTITEFTKNFVKKPGLVNAYVDRKEARLYFELATPNPTTGISAEFIYLDTLRSGLGANEVGLDRGSPGESTLLRFRPVGNRVLVERPNNQFTASSADPDEAKAVEESFPTSIILSLPIKARDMDGKMLVDATDLAVRDAHGSARAMGTGYSLDRDRSTLSVEDVKSFPMNLEFEARLTFASGNPTPAVSSVSPDGRSVTLLQHHSLVALPPDGFTMRPFDVRVGIWDRSVYDFSAPIGQPLIKRTTVRHRLSESKPIVYYVDRGAPEPIRSALIEGARYWTPAFEKAGFPQGFRVELLPADADPDDIRYNVINWVHRSTRGYSYGSTVVDPRTGEIIKGVVSLDSSRGRQDSLVFQGLIGTATMNTGAVDDPVRLSLARLRQLAAHEVGHTLGFSHNFGSSVNDRASVMDYPAPLVRARNGKLDFSQAYVDRIGPWDELLVKYAYQPFPTVTEEAAGLRQIAKAAESLVFLPDADTSEDSGADPRAVRFDNGSDPIAHLREAMEVRKIALLNFGERNLLPNQPLGQLEMVLGPVYFYHRYALNAVLPMVGGLEYQHRNRGDGPAPTQPIAASQQLRALDALLDCVQPDALDLPSGLLPYLAPPAYGYGRTPESFRTQTTYAFDSLSAANTAADLVVSGILNPARCHRIVELSTRNPSLPTLDQVIQTLLNRTYWVPAPKTSRERELRQGVQDVVLNRLMDLADSGSPNVRLRAREALVGLRTRLSKVKSTRSTLIASEINRFLARPLDATPRKPAALPALPGAPIGD